MTNLLRYLEIFAKRKFCFIFLILIIVGIPLLLSYNYKPVYKATANLKILLRDTTTSYGDIMSNVGVYEFIQDSKVDDTFFEMAQNEQSLTKVISKLQLTDDDGNLLAPEDVIINNDLYLFLRSEGFGVELAGNGAEIIAVNGYSTEPYRAVDIANTATDLFIKLNADIFRNQAKLAVKALEKRITVTRSKISQLERTRFEILKKNSIIDISKQIETAIENYYVYIDQYKQQKRTSMENSRKLKELSSTIEQIPEFSMSSKVMERNQLIDTYKNQIIDLEKNIAKLRVDVTESHPDVIALKKQLNIVKNTMRKELDSILSEKTFARDSYYAELFKNYYDLKINIEVNKTTKKILKQMIDSSKNEMLHLKTIELTTNNTDRKISSLNSKLKELTEGLETAKLVIAMEPANVALLNYAQTSSVNKASPYFPNRKKFLYISFFLGIAAGFAFILIAEYTDDTIKNVNDASDIFPANFILGLPCLREKPHWYRNYPLLKELLKLPNLKGKPLWNTRKNIQKELIENKHLKENVWNIIAGFSVYSKGLIPKTILFTGTESDIGTTTTASCIACALALQGKKTLFLNISRKPDNFSRFKNSEKEPKEKNSILQQQILHSEIEGLDFLNFYESTKLSSLTMIDDFSYQFKNMNYDHIIVNSDPIVSHNDTIFISHFVDTVSIITQLRKTQKNILKDALDKVCKLENKNLCIIINPLYKATIFQI